MRMKISSVRRPRIGFLPSALVCVMLLSLLASGCASSSNDPDRAMPLLPQAMPMDPPAGSGMLSLNIHAGDALSQMLLVRMGSGSGILVTNLVELDNLEKTSAFGRLASQQIASRIGQHGFRVLEARLGSAFRMNSQGEFMLTRDTAQLLTTEYGAGAVLVGSYSRIGNRLFISARIVRLADNVLMGAYEYFLPLNEEVRALLGPAVPGTAAVLPHTVQGSVVSSQLHEHSVWARYSARGQTRAAREDAPAAPALHSPARNSPEQTAPGKDMPYAAPVNGPGDVES